MVLCSYVPDLIGANVESMLANMLTQRGHSMSDVDAWAVHPGGRAILDKVQASLSLDESALDASRKVLREYGNMSSATVMFVLKEMLRAPAAAGELTLAMAFGPWLTVETALLERVVGSGTIGTNTRDRQLILETASV